MLPYFTDFLKYLAGFALILAIALLVLHFISASTA
jgi:hypothetical protein